MFDMTIIYDLNVIFLFVQGNPGWGYHTVLHYFKKSEDNR